MFNKSPKGRHIKPESENERDFLNRCFLTGIQNQSGLITLLGLSFTKIRYLCVKCNWSN